MLKLSDFTYPLPPELIAHAPVSPRDHSRLLSVNRTSGQISHAHFYDLPDILRPGDVLVRNNTKVMPARLFGHKSTGGQVEILLTKKVGQTADTESWDCLTKPGLKVGQVIHFDGSSLSATCERLDHYTRLLKFDKTGFEFLSALDQIGQVPLPPYIEWHEDDSLSLRELYQTTYAQVLGSVAAPTAGLHFTPELDAQLLARGVKILELTLHVGLGTFLPVKTPDITQHQMHSEWFELAPDTADHINLAKQNGQRIIAVGTTSSRVLESQAAEDGTVKAGTGETSIFMYPPYRFKCVDALLTNFHLPESTLLMLISALVSQPNTDRPFTTFEASLVGQAYLTAIQEKYRFFSFGDAMLIE